jgi:hypothetical protein
MRMEDLNPEQRGENGASAGREWAEFQQDLEMLGHRLSSLRAHAATLGEHLIHDLEDLFRAVKDAANAWKQSSDRQNEEMSSLARDTRRMYDDLVARSGGASRHLWQSSEPLRQGARDLGEGVGRAWAELKASFSKASSRLSVPPSPSEPQREHHVSESYGASDSSNWESTAAGTQRPSTPGANSPTSSESSQR